jgi:glycyl-tRNA synthetase beta chain
MTAPLADFLLEIGCEEIPARMLAGAASDLAGKVTEVLGAAGLSHGEVRTFCTPRRLAVLVRDVPLAQESRDEEVTGPPAKAAFGTDGQPTKAALGFAQKMGVELSALATISTPKGDYLGVRRYVAGRTAAEMLADGLPRAVAGMSFPKTMRWGDGTRRFVRPVHWIVALLGGEIVPVELFHVRAGRESVGHRILGARRVPLPSPNEYESTLLAQGVAVDRDERRRALSRKLVELAGDEAVRPVEDPELLEEVSDLVEYPGSVLGSFPVEFLRLPREVLITTLRHHQKSFSTETDEGLSNRFLVVADMDRDPEGHIRKGNEWVVVGRLEDARFFFEEDRKVPFKNRREKLKHVTFHAKAGSYDDKSRRIEEIAVALAELINKRGAAGLIDLDALRAAARFCKCDLTTGLVGEFPELQGVAGGIYVGLERDEGRDDHPRGAAEAIYDHYRPAGARDDLPRSAEGRVLALADRLDTLAALARCVGLPTGSRDPFGLRRAALASVRLAAESPLPLTPEEMILTAGRVVEAGLGHAAASGCPVPADILGFLLERFEFWLKEREARYDTINAVLLAAEGERARAEAVPRLVEKVFALERLRELPDFAALVEIHKRCRNILQQAEEMDPSARLDTVLKTDPEEAAALEGLSGKVAAAEQTVRSAMGKDDFEEALQLLVRLRPALSRFFDHVLVMHPDPAVRATRLRLVGRTAAMIEEVADLKQISISREELQRLLEQLSTG